MYRTSSTDSTYPPTGSASETSGPVTGAARPVQEAAVPEAAGSVSEATVPRPTPAPEAGTPATAVRSKTLTVPSLMLLLFAVFSSAGGQIMLKHGMKGAAAAAHDGGSVVLRAATSPWVVLGLLVFAVSAVAWMTTLATVPLSIAYPFNALGYLLIVLAGATVLHERTSLWTWGGSLLVVVGLITVMAGQRR